MYVKICGLSTVASARVAIEAGADAIGVVMSPRSSRHVEPATARRVVAAAEDSVDTVLVVNTLPALDAARLAVEAGCSVLQLHGPKYSEEDLAAASELIPRVWRATSLADTSGVITVGRWGEELLLLDSPVPGSGERWDSTELAGRRPKGRWLLAGGLTPDNVSAAVAGLAPWGVDVSSGVESSPGVKDHDRIRAFIAAARGA